MKSNILKLLATLLIVSFTKADSPNSSKDDINPFEDKKITCQEMEKYPQQIFVKGGLDLGSGDRSPLNVDYNCKKSIKSLGFTDKILNIAEKIRADGLRECTGSVVYAHYRYYLFSLLGWGIAPDMLLKQDEEYEYYVDYLKDGNFSSKDLDEYLKKYFAYWGYSSLGNFKLYSGFWKEYNKIYPLLVEHYIKTFNVSQKKAQLYAKGALFRILYRAAGSSHIMFEKNERVFNDIELELMKPNSNLETIRKKLKNNKFNLDRALRIALLHNKPKPYLKLLLDNGANINTGDDPVDESAIFFVESDIKKIKFLLNNGADINYPNYFGKTILYYAIERNNFNLVTFLLSRGANINEQYVDYRGAPCSLKHTKRTPLMHAAQHSDPKMLKYLISKGANKDQLDEIGFNILDYAYMGNNKKNIDYLKSIGFKREKSNTY